MNHIERMELEAEELNNKITKATEFLENEIKNPTCTNEVQRIKLACQIEYMLNYFTVLTDRINYDKSLLNK